MLWLEICYDWFDDFDYDEMIVGVDLVFIFWLECWLVCWCERLDCFYEFFGRYVYEWEGRSVDVVFLVFVNVFVIFVGCVVYDDGVDDFVWNVFECFFVVIGFLWFLYVGELVVVVELFVKSSVDWYVEVGGDGLVVDWLDDVMVVVWDDEDLCDDFFVGVVFVNVGYDFFCVFWWELVEDGIVVFVFCYFEYVLV